MKNFSLLAILLLSFNASAAVRPFYQDMKLPTQQLVERQEITNPAAAGTANILSAHAGATSGAAVTVTTFVAQPDVPRTIVVTPGGTLTDVGTCDIVVTGTNFLNATMTETFRFPANFTTGLAGANAFKTISSVVFPASCEDSPYGAQWNIGYGEKLGIKRCMRNAGNVLGSTVAGAWESTRPTVAAGSSVQGNTADFNGTMNGANDFELFFFQNFTCL